MLTAELIRRGGSKLEATRLFLERGLDIPIPHSTWHYHGQPLDSIVTEFNKLRKPVIVRGSDRYDWHGRIGVLPTIRDVETFEGLEDAIKQTERFMFDADFKKFADDEGLGHTEEVHQLIQEQSSSNIVGSLLRHPNDPDRIVINYINRVERSSDSDYRAPVSMADYNGGRIISRSSMDRFVDDNKILEVVKMFEKIEASGLLESGWSYHMEFGLKPTLFYQIKPFKQIEEKDFFIYQCEFDAPHLHLYDVIGKTPREGIVLQFKFTNKMAFDRSTHRNPLVDISKPYGLLLQDRGCGDEASITIPMGEMQAFFIKSGSIQLFHGTYRFMKRANVSCFNFWAENFKEKNNTQFSMPERLLDYEGNARLIADGKSGVLIPLEL